MLPKLPISYCGTLVNRAWREIRESQLWSFNLFESAWFSPPPITVGTVTTVQATPTLTFDATAIAAINASQSLASLVTQRQFRVGVGGIYNIISLDPNFNVNGIATIDRPYLDVGGSGQAFQIYQLYYTPPNNIPDFLTWISVRNPAMFLDLDLTKNRAWIDARDPQRTWFQFPTHVVTFGRDQRAGSPTLGFPLFELWGQPVTQFTYQCYGIRKGSDLVNPSDLLPTPIPDDLVLAKAGYYVYQWGEANRDQQPRSQTPDYKYLMGLKEAEYKKLLILYRKQDRELINNYWQARMPDMASRAYGFYNTITGVAGPYTQL